MLPGDVLGGKYRLVRKLGAGAMGVVFEAKSIPSNAPLAVKVLQSERPLPADNLERLAREVRALARLKSQFVARILELDLAGEAQPVLAMELLIGQDLGTELRSAGRLAVDEAAAYLVQACAGVWEAHGSGIIHRDLKPSNLFLERSSSSPAPRVRVLDFALSKFIPQKPSTGTYQFNYQAPEILRNDPIIDARTDVWSLGMILYRALRGRLPEYVASDEEMPRLAADLAPEGLIEVVAKALARKPDDRFDDARELGRALLPFIERPSPTTTAARDELGVRATKAGDDPTTIPNPSDEPTTVPRPDDAQDDVRDQLPTLLEKDEKIPPPREALETMDEAPAPREAVETMDEVPVPAPAPITERTRKRPRPQQKPRLTTSQALPLIGAAVFVVLIVVWLIWFGGPE